MKVLAFVRHICCNCKTIKRKDVTRAICSPDPYHKQCQG